LFYQETLFIGDFERYVNEGSGNGHLSPQGPPWGTWRGPRFPGNFERQMKVGFGNGVSLSLSLRGGFGGEGSLLETLKDM